MAAIGFDVYGTLVDPLEMQRHLRVLLGGQAGSFAALWREKQLEYTFRRGLMRQYVSFDLCTAQALRYVVQSLAVDVSEAEQARLLAQYRQLAAFPDAIPAIERLKTAGHTVVAFSNGVEATVRALLDHAGILPHLDAVISVDDLQTFKPNPAVYLYLARRVNHPVDETWLVSGNPFDVIGAKATRLKTAWVRRNSEIVFDPWGIEPDLIVTNLNDFVERIAAYPGVVT
ncbi:MAG: haloacid dehalogenase type II [Chloroflexota bacterium]|nr:haloacid dehalogenase type II [Chloroflexota bacterium]